MPKNDMDLIVERLPLEWLGCNIYPLGDLHIGSPDFCEESFAKWVGLVLRDDWSRVVLVGDMMDNGLKTSKTDAFRATLSPREQKLTLKKLLEPIRDKIIAAIPGNHEYRSIIMADDCPLYDVLNKLDLEDCYRENMCFVKINVGKRNMNRQYSYTLAIGHGQSEAKTDRFGYAIDGLDIYITGHIHKPKSDFPSKIVIDSQNEVVRLADFTHVVVPSFQGFGGYALRGMYLPNTCSKIPIITLKGTEKKTEVRWL